MKFHIENTDVCGLDRCLVASGNSYRVEIEHHEPTDKDWNRAKKLGVVEPGTGHDTLLNGIVVTMDVYAPLYWWKQAQRYHWFEFISSQSTMHCLTKFDIKDQCVADVDEVILERYQVMLSYYLKNAANFDEKERFWRWKQLVASLPCGFVLGATMTTNYRQLKTMYKQRANHRLDEWHDFCDWCDTLPHFNELTGCSRKVAE